MSYFPVQITSPAQGDILYYDGTRFVNLAPGTSGKFLQTQGASANPVWATVPTPDFSTVPLLAPNSANRNLIQPTADTNKGLVIEAHSDTQSAPLLEIVGGAVNSSTTAPYLTVGGTGGSKTLTVQDNNAAPSSEGEVVIKAQNDGVPALNIWAHPAADSDALVVSQPDGLGNFTAQLFLDPTVLLFSLATSTGALRNIGNISSGFLDNTDATYKGRLTFSCYHKGSFTPREGLRIEDDGTAARIGFLSAAAVVRQTNGTAAQLAAIVDPNVKAFLTALSNGVVNFGLFTAPA